VEPSAGPALDDEDDEQPSVSARSGNAMRVRMGVPAVYHEVF
jgi:hypothetical protein